MPERAYVSFAEVKQKVPIPAVLEVFGLSGQFTWSGKTLTGVCPLPSHQHGPKPNREQFKINYKDGVWLWHCFGDCQKGGDVVELVKELTGYDNAHVRFWFAEHFGESITVQKPNPKRRGKTEPDKLEPKVEPENEAARANPWQDNDARASSSKQQQIVTEPPSRLKPLRFHLNLDTEVPYLFERGLTRETIRRFGLGLCRKGYLNGYVAIPVWGWPRPEGANPIGYLGRRPDGRIENPVDPDSPRYKFPPEFPRNQVVYGLAEALECSPDAAPLIVVEGPFKVYHLFQAGIPNVVATFGASLADEQAELLVQTRRSIVLFFDGDEAGQKGMRTAAAKLITRTFVRVIRLADGTEPDQLSPPDLLRLF